jgi:DNA repair ATPase RecN
MKSEKLKVKIHQLLNLFLFTLFIFNFSLLTIHSQDDPPKDVAPAPEKILFESEENALKKENGIKARTELSLKFMNVRLANAQDLVQKPKFKDALNELGSYQKLLEDALSFLKKNNTESGKVKNNLMRLEMILRKHTVALENIRREMPYKFGWHVEKLMKYIDDAREEAIEPLYDNNVVKINP